jgi:hypothetical protein
MSGLASFIDGNPIGPLLKWFVQCFLTWFFLITNCVIQLSCADIYHYTNHSALQITPYEVWYGIKPHISKLHIWRCYVYICLPDPKILDHCCVTHGLFLGFTKPHQIVYWYHPSTNTVKHANAARFDEHNTKLTFDDTLSPGAFVLSGTSSPPLDLTHMLILAIILILAPLHLIFPYYCHLNELL